MVAYFGFVLNAIGALVPSKAIVLSEVPNRPVPQTKVTITVGQHNNLKYADGPFPATAIWDDEGTRLIQFKGNHNDKIGQGETKTKTLTHLRGIMADPHYIMLSQSDDAICVQMVQVSNGNLTGTFYGDYGYLCGQSWYYSSQQIQNEQLNSRCVWLDADHSGGKNARALSFHTRDMLPTVDRLRLYERSRAYMCDSTPRFSYWKHLMPDGDIPFFRPPLKYKADARGGFEGVDADPAAALDKIKYDKEVYMRQGEPVKAYRRDGEARPGGRVNSNIDPEHVIVTELAGQTATEICSDPNSVGYDIASFEDMKFCDLAERRLYDFCSEYVTSNCFDTNSTTIVGSINARGERSAPVKSYTSKGHWKR